jgi:hypothetical protein
MTMLAIPPDLALKTMMIYAHAVQSATIKQAKSPLDLSFDEH